MKKTLVLIPALNPPENLIEYIKELKENGLNEILIVNDGSSDNFKFIFENAQKMGCVVFEHEKNLGKGKALKNGFKYFLENYNLEDFNGVVTADSDGQHKVEDVLKISKQLDENVRNLILGCRNFDDDIVPARSKFGNKVTINVFRIFYNKKISDTQTGLRGFPNNILKEMLEISGDKFEYETRMLIYCFDNNIKIDEVEISTVYFNNNAETHFNAITDSARIYKVIFSSFLRYLFSSISSFVVDVTLFTLFLIFFKNYFQISKAIIFSTIFARVISSIFNFILNKNYVFNSKIKIKNLIFKYYLLCICIMLSSAFFTSIIWSLLKINETVVKIFVDLFLFLMSYSIQKNYIFKRR